MPVTVVNMSDMPNESVLPVLRTINRQIAEDFAPYWGQPATLRLENPAAAQPDREKPPELRGDAILSLWDEGDPSGRPRSRQLTVEPDPLAAKVVNSILPSASN